MEFWASAEVHEPATEGLLSAWKPVERYLNAALAASSLRGLQCELRYVPIVMPKDMHARYSERSRLRRKERIYVCAPHLDYDVFVDGRPEDQVREYVRGIALSAPHLAGLGATKEQIAEFEAILANVAERVVAERPDQTRH